MGVYKCVFRNTSGSDETQAKVTVKSGINSLKKQETKPKEEDTVELSVDKEASTMTSKPEQEKVEAIETATDAEASEAMTVAESNVECMPKVSQDEVSDTCLYSFNLHYMPALLSISSQILIYTVHTHNLCCT